MTLTEQLGFFLLFFFSVVFRELCRGYAAALLGDQTPQQSGRLTVNPLKHVDLFGTIVLPIMFVLFNLPAIGWARPMPINWSVFKSTPKRMMVILSGMLANAALVAISLVMMIIIGFFMPAWAFLASAFGLLAYINILLVIFYIIPLPPLDGFLLLKEIRVSFVQRAARFIERLHPVVLFLVILGIWNILYPVVDLIYAKLVS